MATRAQREKATAMNAKHTAILNNLMSMPENKVCADCNEASPKWASWNLGIFLCIQCSGIHRRLGVHISKVRSVSLDKWKPEWIQSMEKGGNGKFNREWEYHLPNSFTKLSCSSPAIELYIRDKYERELWRKTNRPPSNPEREIQKYLDADKQTSSGMSEMSYMSQSTSSYSNGMGSSGSGFGSNGAKMQGFGSDGQAHKMSSSNDDILATAISSISLGWNSFSQVTSEYAAIAAEKTKELTEVAREKIQDGDLLTSVAESAKDGWQKVSKTVSKTVSSGLKKSGGGSSGGDFFAEFGMSSGLSRDEVASSAANKDAYFASLQSKNAQRKDGLKPSEGGKYAGFGSSSMPPPSSSSPSRADYERSAANKDSFFADMQKRNASRKEGLPPSKGGKYAGFGPGSIPQSTPDNDSKPRRSTSKTKTKPAGKKRDADWDSGWGSDDEEDTSKQTTSKPNARAAKTKAKAAAEDDWDQDW